MNITKTVLEENRVPGPYLSLMGCQGRFPFLPMPRSGQTATIAFRACDIVVGPRAAQLTASRLPKRKKKKYPAFR